MVNRISLIFIFLFILACSDQRDQQDRSLDEANTRVSRAGDVTVLCRCNTGSEGTSSVSWSGANQASAEAMAKRNCESIQGSVSGCEVVN